MKAPDKIYLHGYPDKPFLCQDWDVAPTMRVVRGQQAENIAYIRADLTELTWEDIAGIVILADTILDGNEKEWGKRGKQAYYEAVLKAFNEYKQNAIEARSGTRKGKGI